MSPALPWVYGKEENANAPEWVKEEIRRISYSTKSGREPSWPQAPIEGKIIYTGDGR